MAFEFDAATARPDGEFDPSTAAPVKPAGAIRRLADVGLAFGQGAAGGTKALTDVFGAGNKASTALDSASKGIGALMSDDAKQEMANRQKLIQEAEASGSTLNEIGANLGGIAEAPARSIAQGAGSIIPTMAAAYLSRGKSLLPTVGIGAAQGAGAVKGSIYDAVQQKQIDAGMSPADAQAAASRAQEFTGPNAANIAAGGALGAVAGRVGAEGAVLGTGAGRGVLRRAGKAAGEEALTEGAQGGQERYSSNVAEQREGFDTPTFQGVAGQAANEGVIGGIVGGGVGAVAGGLEPKPAAPAVDAFDPQTAVLDEPPAPTPSQAMGLDPNAGPISAAAAMAVDGGAADLVQRQAAEQAAAEAAKKTPTKKAASAEPTVPPSDTSKPSPASVFDASARQSEASQDQSLSGAQSPAPPGEALPSTGPVEPVQNQASPIVPGETSTSKEIPSAQSQESVEVPPGRQAPVRATPDARATRDGAGAQDQPAAGGAVVQTGDAQQSDGALSDEGQGGTRAVQGVEAAQTGTGAPPEPAEAVQPAGAGAVQATAQGQQPAGALTVPRKLQVSFGGKTYPVESVEDAQRKWIKFQETANGGAPVGVSKVGNGVQVTDQDGKFVARISFNGRVWDGPGDDAKVIAEAPGPQSVDEAAHQAATSPKNDLPEPTDAQKEKGNYKKGHVKLHGLDVSIENPKGSTRSGKRPDGSTWTHEMSDHYGYIKRSTSSDGEQVDVYVGPKPESNKVFVVDQLDQKTGGFDEAKVMMGFDNRLQAARAYRSNFDKGWKVGPITAMTVDEFKTWLREGDTTKPVAATGQTESAPRSVQPPSGSKAAAGPQMSVASPATAVPPVSTGQPDQSGQKGQTVQPSPDGTPTAPTVKVVSTFTGKFKKGMTIFAARAKAAELNKAGDGITYTAEEHGDATLENPYAVVGRKTQEPVAEAAAALVVEGKDPVALAQAEYDKAKKALDAIGKEPPQRSSEAKAFGQRGRAGADPEVVAKYDADVKAHAAWRRKYSALKKAEVERSNELFYAKKAVQGYVQSDVAPPAPENSDAPAEPEATPATQATAALDAANVTGKERLDVLKDVKAGTLTPEEVKAAYPAPVSSREGQMNLANRGSRIASLKLMNEQLRKIAPDEAWHDKNIEDAKDLDALQDQISEALVKANRGSQDASPLRTELEQLSGAELRTIFEKMNLAGTRMTATERVDALVAENEAEVRAAMASTNTENAGDELTYNKRNRVKSGIKWDDIADKDVALRVKETTKANVHPKPDYQAMVDGGMEPIVAHMVKQAYDSLSVAPNTGNYAPTDADLKRYIDGVHRYMDGVMAWANDKDQIRAWVARIGKRAGVLAGASSGQMTSLSEIAGQSEKSLIDVVYPDGWKNHRDELRSIGGNKALNGLQPSTDEAMKAVKDIEKGWPGKQEAWQRQGYKIVDGKDLKADFYTGKHGNGDPYTTAWLRSGRITIVQRSFDGATSKDDPIVQDWVKLETEAYAGRHVLLNKSNRVVGWGMTPEEAVELARSETKRDGKTTISDKGISVEAAEREGVQHRMDGEDISSDRLKEAFGLKGVNFGNWMLGKSHEKERQLHLNHAYDSFMDLAQALGVPPKALSLNGMLGLAIGAQGNGKAAAHFVPGVNEINLTRTSGAGSLAHEFGHGLDHYFARHADLGRNSDPFLTEYASRKLAGDIRPEIVEAFKTIVQAMNKRPTTQAETALRRQESIKKAKRNVDGWMASIRKDFERIAESDKKAPAGMLEQFDALAQRIKALDLGDGRVAVSGGFTMSQPVSDMRDLYKQATGRVYSLDQIKGLQSNVDHLKYLSDAIDSAAGHVPQQVMTDYAAAALRIDKEKGGKPYWSTNLEKFARAFDAFISDKLEAAAAKNTYLSHAGRTGETVPMGTERTAINAGIQQLIDTIQTKEDDAGNVAMFNTKDDVGGQTQTAAFKKWFSGSKVVDADGNPLVVYHGTKSGGFSTFAVPDMERSGKSGSLTTGAYFTDKKHVSTTHSGPIYRDAESAIALKDKHKISTAAIYDVYLSLQNPKIVNFKGRDWQGEDVHGDVISGGSTDGQAILAKQEGYDGLIIRNVRDTADGARMSNKDARSTVYVAFSPTQIKSAIGNNGTFDPANPDIRFNSDSGPDGLPMFAQAAYTPGNGQQQSTADLTQAAQGNIDRLNRAITRFLDKPGTTARPFQARRLRDHAGLQGLGDAFGAKIQGFRVDPTLRADVAREFDFFNGVYTSGTIYLNENSQRPHLAILGHELAHQLRKTNYVLYRQLVNAIEPFIDKAKYPAFAKTAVGREHANNPEKLREEFVGEVLSDGFMNREFWRAVGKKNPSLLQRIVRMVGELLNKALAKMGYTNRSEQYLTDFNRVMQVAGEVMGEYGLKPPAVAAGGGLSFGRGANAPVATNDDVAGKSLGGRSAGDNTSGVLFTDENENAIVFASGDFRISVNKPGGASFVVLWAKQEVNGKTYWRKAGTLNTNEKSKIINGVAGHYLGVSSVSIEKEYRGRGMGLQMYRALLSQAAPDIAGIISHTPSRVNKKQVPSIYRSLGAFSDGDNQIIPTRRNESTAPDSDGAVSFNTKITGQTARQHTPEQLRAMKNVGFEVEVPTMKERAQALWKDAGKKLAQGIVDQFAPVKAMDGTAYGLLRLAKGASGAFESFLHGGKLKLTDNVYDFDETQKGGVVEKLLMPLQGEHHDFMRWVAANRAERLAAEGKENLFSAQDIADLKTLASGQAAFDYKIQNGIRAGQTTRNRAEIYRDALVTFNGFNKNILDMAEQSGLIDGASRHLWEHEFYVPFYRVADDADGGVRGMNIKGGVLRQQAFKQLKGGKNALNTDLLDNTLMNWAHLLDASAKNRAAKATIEAAERLGVAVGGNQSTLAQMGSSINNKNGVVWFMDGGMKRYSLVDDPYIMTALTSLEYAGMRNPVMNAMSTFKHALTVGVTASPFFKIRNLIRDSVQVIGTGNISYNPAKNIGEGWKLTDPKSDAYFRLLAGGGTIHFGTMLEGSEAKRIQSLVESGVDDATILNNQNKVKAFYRRYIEPSITAYNELGNRGEAINRASLYDQLRKQGISHADASLQARDLMDFSMQGSFTTIRFLTQTVPFLNARLQGLYKLGRAAKEDPKRMATAIGAVTLASLSLLAAYGDDDDWKKREEWDRNNFWFFKFGGLAFRIPKPFEIGAIATLAERGFELAFDDEMTGERFRKQVLTLLGDNLSMNPVPQLVKPLMDVYANKDSFSGRPIETMSMERLKSEFRFTDRTSMIARGASTAANAVTGLVGAEALSPVQIDHMLRGYFGWLGSFVVGAADVIARPATGQPTHPTPDYWKTATGSMISGLRDAPSRYVSQMYEQAREIEQAYGTWRALLKEGKAEDAAEFAQDNREKLSKYHRIQAIKRAESSLNQRIRVIERSDLSNDAKRDQIRVLRDRKDQVARM